MARVEWSDEAIRSVEQIHAYIAQDKPAAAAAFAIALLRAGDSLEALPQRGRGLGGEMRELAAVRPYLIRYAYDPERDLVMILSVSHGARDLPR